mmetsp:Transcript_43695/g.126264  ORF Transcript_43695/g.126264 Transcript_43695/m.126264 type:complete len:283 (+) Transcript_43695:98-946(+)
MALMGASVNGRSMLELYSTRLVRGLFKGDPLEPRNIPKGIFGSMTSKFVVLFSNRDAATNKACCQSCSVALLLAGTATPSTPRRNDAKPAACSLSECSNCVCSMSVRFLTAGVKKRSCPGDWRFDRGTCLSCFLCTEKPADSSFEAPALLPWRKPSASCLGTPPICCLTNFRKGRASRTPCVWHTDASRSEACASSSKVETTADSSIVRSRFSNQDRFGEAPLTSTRRVPCCPAAGCPVEVLASRRPMLPATATVRTRGAASPGTTSLWQGRLASVSTCTIC